jgi:cytochrome c-type biogenesis protein CcmH/NrfG
MFWISAAVLILALLMATIAVVRRWWMVRDMQVRARADEGAVRRKLEEVRKHHETGSFLAQPLQAPGPDKDSDSLHLTDAAHAVRFAREAAVNLAYGNFDVARTCIEEAIRLDPHRDEHKMVLVTVFENTGEHILAREIIDDLLNRRDQLSGDLRKQVEQLKRRSTD